MFKKVLVAEDHELASISIRTTLKDLQIYLDDTDYVFHCDNALARIRKAVHSEAPYELLITDLSFEEDHHQAEITNGTDLIKAVKRLQPDIKILVFSIENRIAKARELINKLGVDAYVPKARRDAQDLKLAIAQIFEDKKYLSPNLRQEEKSHDFTDLDKAIIRLLVEGKKQKEIPDHLKEMDIKGVKLSSVEKRLHLMRTTLGYNNNIQLITYCKERNII